MGSRYKRGTSPKNQAWMDMVSVCPEFSGVYFVWACDEVLYIGSSIKMRERLILHNRKDEFRSEGATKVTWAEFWSGNMREIEEWLIREYRPRLNQQHVEVEVPEGHLICKTCHQIKSLYCFGFRCKPKNARCSKCGREMYEKNAIRPLNMPVISWRSAQQGETKDHRSDTCFVCQKPSHRRFGVAGACKDHFKELKNLAQPGFSKKIAMFEKKGAFYDDLRRDKDYRDLNRVRK